MPVDPTRRRFLAVAAVASVVSAGTLAAATMPRSQPACGGAFMTTADIIQLFASRPKPGKTFPVRVLVSAERPAAAYSRHEPATITAENFRLRKERYDAWRPVDAVMGYWLAAMKMHTAISILQNFGAVEVERYPFIEPEEHGTLVNKYRLAWCKLMLTPGPNSGHVRWKRMQLIAKNYEYTGLKPERIEQAVEADVEWLETHPVRGNRRKPSNSEPQQ